jgi:hypothetical protein
MSFKFFANIFQQSPSLLFSKPRRKKKRFKKEIEAEKLKIYDIIFAVRRKFNFGISSMFLNNTLDDISFVKVWNSFFQLLRKSSHGHSDQFNTLQYFI